MAGSIRYGQLCRSRPKRLSAPLNLLLTCAIDPAGGSFMGAEASYG